MATDVSIYSSRTKTGYLTTVSSGTARSLGSSSFGEAATGAGGGGTGNVKTTGDQRASGIKYWDASANFTYDISVGGVLLFRGTGFDVSIGGIGAAQDGSTLVYDQPNDVWTYGTGGTQINALNDIGDVSVAGAAVNQVLTWKGTYWEPEDVSSAGNVSYSYVDGSLAARDASIDVLFTSQNLQDVSIAVLVVDKADKDVIISNKSSNYTVSLLNSNALLDCTGTITITFPDNLDNGFTCSVINSGTGIVTLDASNLLTTDASVDLVARYAGATAVHKGSGTWYAWGNLQ